MEENESYRVAQTIENMASANLIARFESKMEAGLATLRAEMEAQGKEYAANARAQDRNYKTLIWVIGMGFTMIAALATLIGIFG